MNTEFGSVPPHPANDRNATKTKKSERLASFMLVGLLAVLIVALSLDIRASLREYDAESAAIEAFKSIDAYYDEYAKELDQYRAAEAGDLARTEQDEQDEQDD